MHKRWDVPDGYLQVVPRGRAPKPGPLSLRLARILKDEVSEQVLTQAALGAMVGMSKSQVGKTLRGERTLDVEQLARLCAALGLGIVDVVSDAVKMA